MRACTVPRSVYTCSHPPGGAPVVCVVVGCAAAGVSSAHYILILYAFLLTLTVLAVLPGAPPTLSLSLLLARGVLSSSSTSS